MSRNTLSAFSVALAVALFAFSAAAQNNNRTYGGAAISGVPASVTSFGFGGQARFHGVPASVTSLNFGRIPRQMPPVFFPERRHHHQGSGNRFPASTVYVPYAYSYPFYVMEPGPDDSLAQGYAPAPERSDENAVAQREKIRQELNDLRSEVEDYRSELNSSRNGFQPEKDAAPEQAPVAKQEAPEPPVNQPKTVLVFKDGHTAEIQNYAIVGNTLYDVSDGLTKKFALAELDLPATMKQNGDRGLDFQLPAAVKKN